MASLCAETESTLQDGVGGWESDTQASITMPGAAWPPAGLPPATLRPLQGCLGPLQPYILCWDFAGGSGEGQAWHPALGLKPKERAC